MVRPGAERFGIYLQWVGACIIIGASIFTVHRKSRRKQRLASGADAREFSHS